MGDAMGGGRFYHQIQSFIALAGDQQEHLKALQRSRLPRRRKLLICFARQQKRLRGKKRTFWISENCHKPGAMIILQNNISKFWRNLFSFLVILCWAFYREQELTKVELTPQTLA